MFANKSGLLLYLKIYGLFILGSYILYRYVGHDIFNMIFQWASSVGLIIFGIYFFRKRAVPAMVLGIEQRRESVQQLRNYADALNSKKHMCEQQLADQRILVDDLSEKVHDWHAVWNQKNAQKNKEQKEIRAKLIEKRAVQSYNTVVDTTRNKIIARAVSRAREELGEHFSSRKHGESFLAEILGYLRQEIQ